METMGMETRDWTGEPEPRGGGLGTGGYRNGGMDTGEMETGD